MKKDWTKQMKQKLDGHQMTPPAGLWESISSQMQLQSESVPTPAPAKTVAMRRWYWLAAAAILATVGFFAVYQFDTNEPQLVAHSQKEIAPKAQIDKPSMPEAKTVIDKTPIAVKSKASVKPTLLAQVAINNTAKTEPKQEIQNYEQQESVIDNEQAPTIENQQVPDDTKNLASTEKKQTYLPDVVNPGEPRSKSSETDKWTIGLNGSNGLLMASNNIGNNMPMQYLNSDPSFAVNGTANMTDCAKYGENYSYAQMYTLPDEVSKHKLPIRLGLLLQYQLSNRIALHSGISYTYLESEFTMPLISSNNYTQKLRYLGIPLGASWNVWQTGNLNVYLSGTALIEKCIKAEVTNGDIDQHPWQFSLNAAAGAEYNIIRQFGLYIEPSIGYYFNDGSSLQHYYKEHPLAPSLQFGLRLHLK